MIQSLEELQQLACEKKAQQEAYTQELRVCIGSSCASLGSNELQKELNQAVMQDSSKKQCKVKGVGCNGLCSSAILVSHYNKQNQEETLYENVKTEDIPALVNRFENDNAMQDKLCDMRSSFFTKQKKIVLENAGIIDPDDIEDYIAQEGYLALFTALEELSPQEIIEEIKLSGLRGRGGGGYPTGLKWETVSKVESEQKYIVCNGDEGDPGAFMDRAVMEADPHKVLEGMIIAEIGRASCGERG